MKKVSNRLKIGSLLATLLIVNGNISKGEENKGIVSESYSQSNVNNVEKVELKGNGIIKSTVTENYINSGMIKGTVNLESIINAPDVQSESVYSKNGNGIYTESKIMKLRNSGIINGESNINDSSSAQNMQFNGNGIFTNLNGNIDILENDGSITGLGNRLSGTGESTTILTGNGIALHGDQTSLEINEIKSLKNNGIINGEIYLTGSENSDNKQNSAYSYGAGNGVSIYNESQSLSSSELGLLNNNGIIRGAARLESSDTYATETLRGESAGEMTGNGVSLSFNRNETFLNEVNNSGNIEGEVLVKSGDAVDITNANATIYTKGISAGNGISLYSKNSEIKTLNNKGLISGNGVFESGSAPLASKGRASTYFYGIGNGVSLVGIAGSVSRTITDTKNDGVISGYISSNSGEIGDKKSLEKIEVSGNGISVVGDIGDIENLGVIKGSQSAIAAWGVGKTGEINQVDNLGILAGREIFSDGVELIKNDSTTAHKDLSTIDPTTENNFGLYIKLKSEMNGDKSTGKVKLDNNGNPIIEQIINGLGGEVTLEDGTHKTVLNGTPVGTIARPNTVITTGDSFLLSSALPTDKSNLIINGAGIAKGALVVDQNTDLTDSIVNSYNTAVYLEGDKSLIATNTIFNGGGLKGDIAVVKGDAGNNIVSLNGTSIVNGSIDLGDGSDTLNISTETQLNGVLNGGLGDDTLGLGNVSSNKERDSLNLNILHDISGFENVATNGNVTLFETAAITDAVNITLESGNLTLRVDPTKTIVEDGKTKVIGHALYENSGNMSSTGGNLVVGLNGLGTDAIVSMGGTTIASEANDSWWKDSDHIKTNSLVLDGKLSNNGKDIDITLKESIPLEPSIPVDPPVDPEKPEPPVDPPTINGLLYEKLNAVYKSIVSSEEIGTLANTTLLEDKTYNESLGGLLVALDQIYANNPYAYTLKSSRDSLKLFEDNMSYLTIKPEEGQWIAQGKAIYTGVKNDNDASGKNYYGFDTGHRNYKTTTNTVGGIATAEYGLTDKTSIGFVFGGNNQDISFKGTSQIDGTSLYLGTFAKTEVNNFRFTTGIGYQYTSADVDRGVSNGYDSFKTNEKYGIDSFNTFAEVKYVAELGNNWTLEPKTRVSVYHVRQDSVDEGYTPGQLSIEVDKANSTTTDIEVGVDVTKSVYTPSAKVTNILSVGVIKTLGDREEDLTGRVIGNSKNGSDFEIQGVELPEVTGRVAYNLEIEGLKGMIYTAGLNYEFAEDNNKNIEGTIGLGYRF